MERVPFDMNALNDENSIYLLTSDYVINTHLLRYPIGKDESLTDCITRVVNSYRDENEFGFIYIFVPLVELSEWTLYKMENNGFIKIDSPSLSDYLPEKVKLQILVPARLTGKVK